MLIRTVLTGVQNHWTALQGVCGREGRCRFRHCTRQQYDMEMAAYQHRGRAVGPDRSGVTLWEEDWGGQPDRKRRCMGGSAEPHPPPHPPVHTPAFQLVQEENLQLRTQIQELEKRVSDLTATNEFLLDQNAQLRMGGKPQVNCRTNSRALLRVSSS